MEAERKNNAARTAESAQLSNRQSMHRRKRGLCFGFLLTPAGTASCRVYFTTSLCRKKNPSAKEKKGDERGGRMSCRYKYRMESVVQQCVDEKLPAHFYLRQCETKIPKRCVLSKENSQWNKKVKVSSTGTRQSWTKECAWRTYGTTVK